MATSSKKQIFISYNHESKNVIKKIVEHLKEEDFNVWVDTEQLSAGAVWKKEIAKGISNADLVICFISKKYCESENCMIEFEFCIEKKKPYIFVLLENLKKEEYNNHTDINAVRLSLSGKLQFYAYKPPNTFEPWSEELFKDLLKSIINQIGEEIETAVKQEDEKVVIANTNQATVKEKDTEEHGKKEEKDGKPGFMKKPPFGEAPPHPKKPNIKFPF